MLQRLGIRGKLLAVVAVPILVLVLAAGFITYGSVQDLNSARNTASLIDTLGGTRALETVLQEERRAAVNYVSSEEDGADALTAAVGATGWALADVTSAIDGLETDGDDGADDAAAPLRDQVAGALGATDNASILADERALEVVPASEGEWATFPDEPAISAMSEGYESAAAGLEAIADGAPGAVSAPLLELATQIRAEEAAARAAYAEPVLWQQALEEIYPAVDAAVAGLLGRAEELASDERNQPAVESLLEGRSLLDNLESTRASTRSLSVLRASLTGYYDAVLGRIVGAPNDVVVAVTDSALIESLRAYGDLAALDERLLREGLLAERIIRVGAFATDGGEADLLRDFQLRTDLALETAQSSSLPLGEEWALPPFGASADITDDRSETFASIRTSISSGLDFSLSQESPEVWAAAVEAEAAMYEESRSALLSEIEGRSTALTQAAVTQLLLTIAIAALVIVLSVVVALVIARRITGPLRRLTTTATAVRQELPRLVERVAMPGETVDVTEVQIPVESRDEVGRLAEAFNGVNAATLAIAGEQAALRGSISEMFVNVARRDQVLLNRQLSSIDEMERSEDNQETLTKLFALDHLATRMRRNSESLLVLAGIDTGRRLRRPMPLSDVVRTASSEIELYERVQLELDADPAMLGHSALTAAHMFAELLENATVFSDPGSPVVVRTAEHGDDYVVEIEDSGIGMTEKELEAANNRVASTAASEILGAQRLGLFVVGRIARRVGARVELQSQEGAGTLATVTMPRALFAKDEEAEPRHVSPAAIDDEMHVPAALVPHARPEEIHEASRPVAEPSADAYIPTAMEEGTSLAGRGDVDAGDPDSIDALIAADAAAAPAAEPTRPADLTNGSSPSGLPARRRREVPSPADAERDQHSIVGLPARATDAQMSALAAEQAGGFSPAISPTEIAPQSPEQRSSMFRGFRSRRETEQQVEPTLEPDGDATDGVDAERAEPGGDVIAAESTPQVEIPEVGAAAFFSRRDRRGPSAADQIRPEAPPEDSPADEAGDGVPVFRMPKMERAQEPAAAEQAPTPLFEPDESAGGAEYRAPVVEDGPFVVPSLEADEPDETDEHGVPEPFAGAHVDSAVSVHSVPSLSSAAELDDDSRLADPDRPHVSAYDAPTEADTPAPAAFGVFPWDAESAPQPNPDDVTSAAPGFMAASERYAVDEPGDGAVPDTSFGDDPAPLEHPPADPVAAGPDVPQVATPVAGAVPLASVSSPAPWGTSTQSAPDPSPSLDDLIQSAVDEETEQSPGFFSRLFGRGRRGDSPAEPPVTAPPGGTAAQWAATDAPLSVPSTTSPPTAGADVPAADEPAQPASWKSAPSMASAPGTSFAPQTSFAPVSTAPPEDGPAQTEAPPASAGPWERPESQRSEQAEPWTAPQELPRGFQPEPSDRAVSDNRDLADHPDATAWASHDAPPEEPPAVSSASPFTADQLAQASGWETAGANALEAAEPEGATTYQPVIQPDMSGDGGTDITSAVFSELSSLDSERPKVEKTRAGLQRRRPADAAPVEVTPIEEDAPLAPAERDADAVRSRFTSFYVGTQRARDDVAAFERQTEPAEASES